MQPLTIVPQTSARFGHNYNQQQKHCAQLVKSILQCSKQQTRQPDERLCFHCNLPGHIKRNCPEIPYCSKCRTKGHTQDRCMNKPQQTRHTHPAGEPRDQQKRKDDLPQFSSRHNKCLQCGGDHHAAVCT